MLDEELTLEYYKMLEKEIDSQGYTSTIPVKQYLPRNYSDALACIEYFKRMNIIVKKDSV